ncbi:glycosyltransferase family 1 protein [Siphonobacter sp. SORGH_AS_1065]|uniref:glycosyltransferase family 4 protein n=1 Tax=Siphonobacter sp. SORGH_AS_1065 TaxID=3041795 RepID=UPI002787DFA1|nr:glycosyltransferase family 1 protein [Siphonobacter sp. SORGH_AS_1065]MDQ1089204.1 glycosyltransferase involved in cell wall biosynthesis [Siphonobacter sp. SORGH_AS_1065]
MASKILLTADQMATSSTGLYHFTLELAREIITQNSGHYRLNFLVPSHLKDDHVFGKATYRTRSVFNKTLWKFYSEFDLIHFTQQHPTLIKPTKIKGKKILTIHDLNYIYEYPANSEEYKNFEYNLSKWVEAADHLTAISQYAAHDIARHFNYPIQDIKVIYNGVNIPNIPTEQIDTHTPKYRPARPFLFTIGTVVSKKNFHVLPGMMHYLDFDLVIAGRLDESGKDYYQRILDECQEHGISPDRIHLIGEVSELDKHWYYKHCTAFVFPSIAEGFGLPVLEAYYYHKPTFLSNHTALPEIGGEAAYYFTSFEPEEMAEVVKKGLSDFPHSDKVKLAQERVELFSWKKSAADYLSLYKEILKK